MGKTLEYQGYTIQSSPPHLADGEKWQLRIFVSVDNHQGVKAREFSADVLYATEQEADIHGIAFESESLIKKPSAEENSNCQAVLNLC